MDRDSASDGLQGVATLSGCLTAIRPVFSSTGRFALLVHDLNVNKLGIGPFTLKDSIGHHRS